MQIVDNVNIYFFLIAKHYQVKIDDNERLRNIYQKSLGILSEFISNCRQS